MVNDEFPTRDDVTKAAYLGSINEVYMSASVESDPCEGYILWKSENWLQQLRHLWIKHCYQETVLLRHQKSISFKIN